MKHATLYFSLLFFVLAFDAYAQADQSRDATLQDVILQGTSAITPDLYQGTFTDVLGSGDSPLFDEAVMAEGKVTDPEGFMVTSRMTFVPLVNAAKGTRGYFMRVSVSSLEGEPLFDHEFTVHDQECSCMAGDQPALNDSRAGPSVETQSMLSDARMIRDWVKARKWSSIKRWIAKQVARRVADSFIAAVVKKGFELAGYRCPDLPWYIPGKAKALIYMTSCWSVAHSN